MTRYISNLNLKYLDCKFIAIDDLDLLNSSISHIRRSKNLQFPSLISSIHQKTTQQGFDDIDTLEKGIAFKKTEQIKKKEQGQKQILKYRRMINRIKRQNELIHQGIIQLHRKSKDLSNQPKSKKISKISQILVDEQDEVPINQTFKSSLDIYQKLSHEDNPYRKESQALSKKLASTSLHKNFETFLMTRNKRIPEFIKGIR